MNKSRNIEGDIRTKQKVTNIKTIKQTRIKNKVMKLNREKVHTTLCKIQNVVNVCRKCKIKAKSSSSSSKHYHGNKDTILY